ncbi:Epidermal patterning factor-like protein [Psidium guajava]|nr:Epidermal patterning factor-like protein [Psidium guajava]
MNSNSNSSILPHSVLICTTTPLVLLFLLLLLSPPSFSRQGLSFEEKTRLGSTPPSCHSKCNGCHPCMAVQVPSVPAAGRKEKSEKPSRPAEFVDSSHASPGRYSNYKPLGWKCRCRNHLFNP